MVVNAKSRQFGVVGCRHTRSDRRPALAEFSSDQVPRFDSAPRAEATFWAHAPTQSPRCSEVQSALHDSAALVGAGVVRSLSVVAGGAAPLTAEAQQLAARLAETSQMLDESVTEWEGAHEFQVTKCMKSRLRGQRSLRDIRKAASGVARARQGEETKNAKDLEGLRDGEGRWERAPSRWSEDVHAYFDRKYRGAESIERQRECVARWQSATECARKDGTGNSPTVAFDDCVEDKHRLRKRKGPGRDDMPAELLACGDRWRMPRCSPSAAAGSPGGGSYLGFARIGTSTQPGRPGESWSI